MITGDPFCLCTASRFIEGPTAGACFEAEAGRVCRAVEKVCLRILNPNQVVKLLASLDAVKKLGLT